MAPHVEVNSPIDYSVSKDYVLVRASEGKVQVGASENEAQAIVE